MAEFRLVATPKGAATLKDPLAFVASGEHAHAANTVFFSFNDKVTFERAPDIAPLSDGSWKSWLVLDYAPPRKLEGLQSELRTLRARVDELQGAIRALTEAPGLESVVLRDIPREQAKDELLTFFRDHPGSYPSDAAEALRLDAALARDLAGDLMSEGRLEG